MGIEREGRLGGSRSVGRDSSLAPLGAAGQPSPQAQPRITSMGTGPRSSLGLEGPTRILTHSPRPHEDLPREPTSPDVG